METIHSNSDKKKKVDKEAINKASADKQKALDNNEIILK